jgi:UDP-N-acetylglucosamine 1-carboxyvinyltransferase
LEDIILATRLRIKGGKKLEGNIRVSGAKNAVVAIIPATILAGDTCTLENVPQLLDVLNFQKILQSLGAKAEFIEENTLRVDPKTINTWDSRDPIMGEFRASYYVLGALLARFGKAQALLPGGCNIGVRPIDQHIKGFEALGATVEINHGVITVEAENGLVGNTVYLDIVSVGATINIMLAAAGASGTTIIENAAREPEIVDVANFLSGIGARVRGAGTGTIRVTGTANRSGLTHPVIPDRIEAGTWLALATATNSDITVENVIPVHLEAVIAKLKEMGATVEEGEDYIRIVSNGELKAVDLKTFPYPGLATDMQSQMLIPLIKAEGVSTVIENIYNNRFRVVNELSKMGVKIKVDNNIAVVEGPQELTAATVRATDLRCSAALVIAGLCAKGETVMEHVYHLDRGYEKAVEKLRGVGADITREEI